MIAIIISTCLINDPTVCREQEIPLNYDMSATRCVMTAPPHVARWCEDHPEWRVVRWQCRSGSRRDI